MLQNPTQSLVKHEILDRMAIITVDNPPVNALDFGTKWALFNAFRELEEQDSDIEVVILTGSGDFAFIVGEDIGSLPKFQPEMATERLRTSHALVAEITKCNWPVIAAVQGYCLGEGLELAISCDVRYASEDALIGLSGVNPSFLCIDNKMTLDQNSMSLRRSSRILDSGVTMKAREALQYGLVDRVVPNGQVLQSALGLAQTIVKHVA